MPWVPDYRMSRIIAPMQSPFEWPKPRMTGNGYEGASNGLFRCNKLIPARRDRDMLRDPFPTVTEVVI